MQARSARRRAGTHSALIAGCVVLFFALQGLLAPLVATVLGGAPPADGATVSVLAYNKICHRDAGDPFDQAGHDHDACCILCQAKARDAAPVVIAAYASALIAPPRGAAPGDQPEYAEPRPKSMGWASSWSSRAPPAVS